MEKDLVRMATELTRQRRRGKLKNEQKWLRRKPALQSWRLAWSRPQSKRTKLNNRDTEKYWPETYTSDRVDRKSFAEFLGEVEKYLRVLAVGLLERPLLQPIVLSDVEANEATHGNSFDWRLKEVSKALGPFLYKVCKGSAGVKLKAVLKIDGFNAWGAGREGEGCWHFGSRPDERTIPRRR